ncbi:MAG: LeuA family protein [Terriglobales bacterium]
MGAMMSPEAAVDGDGWIYDWNQVEGDLLPIGARVWLNDETLRDGLQSPSVRDPGIDEKLALLHLMARLGVHSVDLGLPAAGPRAYADVLRLAQEIARQRLPLQANCAVRTLETDILPLAEISQAAGLPIMAAAFIGSSPIRRIAEDWSLEYLAATSRGAVRYARQLGLPVMFVTEDTTRCDPGAMRTLYGAAIEEGAEVVVVCDTVGHATPAGVAALLRYFRGAILPTNSPVRLDWHGHSDRGLAVANSLAAVAAGANGIHGCALGIGERVGNTPLDQVMVNLRLMGALQGDLTALGEYCQAVSRATGIPVPANYPVFGADAFRTATGVHAAAVVKGLRKGNLDLADRVYSGVPARWFGRRQEIELGPMSGKWNVIFWLEQHGYAADDEGVEYLLAEAKRASAVLSDAAIEAAWSRRPARGALHG